MVGTICLLSYRVNVFETSGATAVIPVNPVITTLVGLEEVGKKTAARLIYVSSQHGQVQLSPHPPLFYARCMRPLQAWERPSVFPFNWYTLWVIQRYLSNRRIAQHCVHCLKTFSRAQVLAKIAGLKNSGSIRVKTISNKKRENNSQPELLLEKI